MDTKSDSVKCDCPASFVVGMAHEDDCAVMRKFDRLVSTKPKVNTERATIKCHVCGSTGWADETLLHFPGCHDMSMVKGKSVPQNDGMLTARESTHGDFNDHARITQNLKRAMQIETTYSKLADTQREALEMIQHKIGRILAGNPNYEDHWRDIAGYAIITADRLPKKDK